MAEGARGLWSLPYKGAHPIPEGSALLTWSTSHRLHLLMPSPWGFNFNLRIWGTHIQTLVAPFFISARSVKWNSPSEKEIRQNVIAVLNLYVALDPAVSLLPASPQPWVNSARGVKHACEGIETLQGGWIPPGVSACPSVVGLGRSFINVLALSRCLNINSNKKHSEHMTLKPLCSLTKAWERTLPCCILEARGGPIV